MSDELKWVLKGLLPLLPSRRMYPQPDGSLLEVRRSGAPDPSVMPWAEELRRVLANPPTRRK